MRNNLKIILLFFLLFIISCEKFTSNKDEITKVEESKSVFLDFSPDMNLESFEKLKNEYNNNGILKYGGLEIPILSKNYIFKVIKKENSICLTYLNIAEEEIKVKNLPYLSRLYHKKNEKIIDELIMIYSKKYNEKNVIFPNTNKINGTVYNNIIRKEYEEKEIFRTLSNYNLNQSCYKIFDDSTKIIVLGYQIEGNIEDIIGFELSDRNILTAKEVEKSPLLNSTTDTDINKVLNSKDLYRYGIAVEIDYFLKKDFDDLITKMKNDSITSRKNLNRIKFQKQKTKNNLEKL
jgi:hypothetical protein